MALEKSLRIVKRLPQNRFITIMAVPLANLLVPEFLAKKTIILTWKARWRKRFLEECFFQLIIVCKTNFTLGHILLFWKGAEEGLCSYTRARLSPIWPGFESRRQRHIWCEFIVGSRPCYKRFFFGYFSFFISLRTNSFKVQFDQEW